MSVLSLMLPLLALRWRLQQQVLFARPILVVRTRARPLAERRRGIFDHPSLAPSLPPRPSLLSPAAARSPLEFLKERERRSSTRVFVREQGARCAQIHSDFHGAFVAKDMFISHPYGTWALLPSLLGLGFLIPSIPRQCRFYVGYNGWIEAHPSSSVAAGNESHGKGEFGRNFVSNCCSGDDDFKLSL